MAHAKTEVERPLSSQKLVNPDTCGGLSCVLITEKQMIKMQTSILSMAMGACLCIILRVSWLLIHHRSIFRLRFDRWLIAFALAIFVVLIPYLVLLSIGRQSDLWLLGPTLNVP